MTEGAPGRALPADELYFMACELFQASHWIRNNLLFSTIIEVSNKVVRRRRRWWFTWDEMSVSLGKVASVHISTGLRWADILIEPSGGSGPLISCGYKKADAVRIKELIETYQAELLKSPGGRSL
jgi:hypothetical protein